MPRLTRNLTPRQIEVMGVIKLMTAQKGYPPTRTELAAHFGWASLNSAQCHLKSLAKNGAIALDPNTARGIRIIP